MFSLEAHIARQSRLSAADLIREACRLIAGCQDAHRRALAMVELRRMQSLGGFQ